MSILMRSLSYFISTLDCFSIKTRTVKNKSGYVSRPHYLLFICKLPGKKAQEMTYYVLSRTWNRYSLTHSIN